EAAFAKIGELAPQTDAQRSLKERAVQVSTDIARTRLALFVQAGSSVPMLFLAVLVFWLAIICASFSLFVRLNPTLVTALVVFAFSASAALFLILEMSEPFVGLMRIPSAPRCATHFRRLELSVSNLGPSAEPNAGKRYLCAVCWLAIWRPSISTVFRHIRINVLASNPVLVDNEWRPLNI